MNPNPRKVAPIVLSVLAILSIGYWAFTTFFSPRNGAIKASGTVEATEIVIASELAGKVVTLSANEGDSVVAAQPLITLDDSTLKAQRAQAAASLALASTNYDSIKSGAAYQQSAANLARAEKEVVDAQRAYDDVNDTAASAKAQAEKDLARAKDLLDTAETDFRNLTNPDLDYYQRLLNKANDAFKSAQEQTNIIDIGKINGDLKLARDFLKKLDDELVKDTLDAIKDCQSTTCPDRTVAWFGKGMKLTDAKDAYNDAVNRVKLAEFQQAQALRSNQIAIDDLKKRLDDAKVNYDDAKTPDPLKVAVSQGDVAIAKARVADAQKNYDRVKNSADPDKLASAKARLDSAKAAAASAKSAFESEQLKTAQSQLDMAKASLDLIDAQLGKTKIITPANGTILSRAVEQGEYVSPGATLFVLADLTRLTITVYVSEDRYGEIKLGQTANVAADSFPNQTFSAKVTHIASKAEFTPRNVQTAEGRKTTVFAIRLTIDGSDNKLKPGMPADVVFGK